MRVIEVCPECGADITVSEIFTDPPIPVRRCTKCNWKWEGEQEGTLRVPFNPDGYESLTVPNENYVLKVPTINKMEIRKQEYCET